MEDKTKYRMKVAGAATAAAGATALLLWALQRPMTDRLPPPPCPPTPTAPRQADPNDGICEADKGEADPSSATFSPHDCGYCGDRVRQHQSDVPRPEHVDEYGERVQDVTQRPSETPETCPFEWRCENPLGDRRKYSVLVPPPLDGGTWSYSVVDFTVTQAECPRATSTPTRRRVRRPLSDGGSEEVTDDAPQRTIRCPDAIVGHSSSQIISSQSDAQRAVSRRITDSFRDHAAELRRAIGATPDEPVSVWINMLVSPSGTLSIQGVDALCTGRSCGDMTTIINIVHLSLTGLSIGAPGVDCTWPFPVVIPRA